MFTPFSSPFAASRWRRVVWRFVYHMSIMWPPSRCDTAAAIAGCADAGCAVNSRLTSIINCCTFAHLPVVALVILYYPSDQSIVGNIVYRPWLIIWLFAWVAGLAASKWRRSEDHVCIMWPCSHQVLQSYFAEAFTQMTCGSVVRCWALRSDEVGLRGSNPTASFPFKILFFFKENISFIYYYCRINRKL